MFTGSGLATSFLAPVALALYWPRLNVQGAMASMLFGFLSNMVLYAIGTYLTGSMNAYEPLGLHPFLVGSLGALLVAVVVSYATPAPKQ